MKSLKLFFVLFLAIGFTLTSCDKDDDDNDEPNNTTGGELSATIDGNEWSASLSVGAVNSSGVISVTGSDANSNQLQISILNATSTGTYSLGGSMTNSNYGRWTTGTGQSDTYTTMLGQGSGEVTITELTADRVKGTFYFDALNDQQQQVDVTSGSFNAKFQ